MRSSRFPSSPRWRLRGDTRCVCVATKSPRSNQKTLAVGTADVDVAQKQLRDDNELPIDYHTVIFPTKKKRQLISRPRNVHSSTVHRSITCSAALWEWLQWPRQMPFI